MQILFREGFIFIVNVAFYEEILFVTFRKRGFLEEE